MKDYDSEHGKFEDKGEQIESTITGRGMLPCGTYRVTVSSVTEKDGLTTLILDEPAKGLHIEEIKEPLPDWIKLGREVEVGIGLGPGVYARRNNKGEMALFDSVSEERVSVWTKNIVPFLKGRTLAEPTISSIRHDKNFWESI